MGPIVHQLALVGTGLGIAVLASAALYAASSPLASQFGFPTGIFSTRNALAHACVLVLTIAIGLLHGSWLNIGWNLVVAGLASYWLSTGGSKTPLFSAALCLVTFAYFAFLGHLRSRASRLISPKRLISVAVLPLAFVAASGFLVRDRVRERLFSVDSVLVTDSADSLSSRFRYWRGLYPHIADALSTGYGHGQVFFSTNRPSAVADRIGFGLSHAHNGFIDALLDGGIVLLVLELVLVGLAFLACWQHAFVDPVRGGWLAAIVVCALSLNLTEPDFLVTMRPTLLVIILIAASRNPPKRSAINRRVQTSAEPLRPNTQSTTPDNIN